MKAEDILNRIEEAYHGKYTGVDQQDMLSKLNSYESDDLVTLYAALLNTFSKRFKTLPGPCEIEQAVKYNRESEDARPIRKRKQEESIQIEQKADAEERVEPEVAIQKLAEIRASFEHRSNTNGLRVFHSM
jgi:hypothetical protein